MLYREVNPPDELRQVVLSLWEFIVLDSLAVQVSHEIFPDGCVSLFYIRNLGSSIHFAGLSGLYTRSVTKQISAGDTIWGLRLSPAACSAILGVPAVTMVDRSTFDDKEFPHLLTGLAAELRYCETFDEAAPILAGRVRTMIDPASFDAAVGVAVQVIDSLRGEIHVDELARRVGLSTRQLQRRFKSASGLSPKTYIRARRVRAAAVDLVESGSRSWANRAAEFGFADQSHMTKEFVAITKRAPKSFAKKVDNITHGHLVK